MKSNHQQEHQVEKATIHCFGVDWAFFFFGTSSRGKKNVSCFERGQEKVKWDYFWDRYRICKEEAFALWDWLWATICKVHLEANKGRLLGQWCLAVFFR